MTREESRLDPPDLTASSWLRWTIVALMAALTHVLIDYHIGLFGEHSSRMALIQALAALSVALLFGTWAAAIGAAGAGGADALRVVFWFTVVEAALLNGALGFVGAPPPADAFPYQDVSHGASLTAGVVAAVRIRRALQAQTIRERRWLTYGVSVLVAANLIILALQLQQTLPDWLATNR